MPNKIPESDLLTELNSIAELLDRPPSKKDFKQYAEYSPTPYIQRYGNWGDALEEAGLEAPNFTNSVPREALLNDFERVGNELGRTPTPTDIREHGRYAKTTYADGFGTWGEMVEVSTFDRWKIESGEGHPSWEGGHDEYYGPNWREQREKAIERDDHECQVCGLDEQEHQEKFDQALHVHHIVPVRKFDDNEKQNELRNLVTLCQKCHFQYEGWNLRPDV